MATNDGAIDLANLTGIGGDASGDTSGGAGDAPIPDDLIVPDDFGAEVLEAFKARHAAEVAAGAAGGPSFTPPGGASDSADVKHIDLAALAATLPAEDGTADSTGDGEQVPGEAGSGDDAGAGDATTPAEPAPATVPAATPAADPAASTPAAPGEGEATPVPAPSTGYTWTEGDNSQTFDDATVQRALATAAWAENLDPNLRTAFGAIETGQAVAIPRGDYDQFVAWQQSQSKATRDADLRDIATDDPDAAALITRLRDENDALKGTTPTFAPIPAAFTQRGLSAAPNPALVANLDNTAAAMQTAIDSYGTQRGLSADDTRALMDTALAAQVIPHFAEQLATVSPTGQVIRPADPAEVINMALDFALVRNPVLSSRVNQQAATPAPSTVTTAADAALTAKKARAASVASAPSAAVTPTPRTTPLSQPETVKAMEAELAAVMNRG